MRLAWQYLRSLAFNVQMYVVMALMAVVFTPYVLIRREGAYQAVRTYCRWVRWTASWMVGLRSEVRGEVPTDEVLIAAKHQSFFDVIILVSVLPRPKFVMKKQLRWAPIVGWYATRIGCIPIDRGKRSKAVEQMVAGVERVRRTLPGQLIVYPQGTRVAPGVKAPYKIGVAVLYERLGLPCVPAATNVGLFWPRRGILRRPGLAVVEFLPRIEPGMEARSFIARLEEEIESASDRLMAEAGFVPEGAGARASARG